MIIGCLVSHSGLDVAGHLAAALPEHDVVIASSPEDLAPCLASIEALVVTTPLYTTALMELLATSATRLRWIQSLSTGVDHYLRIGLPPGVRLSSASGTHAAPVADHALALILALTRGLAPIVRQHDRRRYDYGFAFTGVTALEGLEALVVGHGSIGAAICRRLLGFDAHVTAFSRHGDTTASAYRVLPLRALTAELPRAQLIVLALPETPQTMGLIGTAELAAMRPGILLVNVGRGSVLDEAALVAAAHSGKVGGIALDVLTEEPAPADSPLWDAPNVLLSPHMAGFDQQLAARQGPFVVAQIERLIAGETPLNIVDGKVG